MVGSVLPSTSVSTVVLFFSAGRGGDAAYTLAIKVAYLSLSLSLSLSSGCENSFFSFFLPTKLSSLHVGCIKT